MIRLVKFARTSKREFASVLIAASVIVPTTAFAQDERLVTQPYHSDAIVRVTGRIGVQATIGFGEKEAIENVAVGDAESWQITPNKRADLLFVKPLAANAHTNMTVVTDKHTYFFDLVASPQSTPLYMLRFSYKDEAKPATSVTRNTDDPQIANDLAHAKTDPARTDPARINFAWARQGDETLLPARIYDDGDATYVSWDTKQQLPAILVLNEKGEEGPVNYAVRDSIIVIDAVPGKIVLRRGKRSASLEHKDSAANLSNAISEKGAIAFSDTTHAAPSVTIAQIGSDGSTQTCPSTNRFMGGPYGDRRLKNAHHC